MFAFIAYFKARLQALIKDQKKRSFSLLYIHEISFDRIAHFITYLFYIKVNSSIYIWFIFTYIYFVFAYPLLYWRIVFSFNFWFYQIFLELNIFYKNVRIFLQTTCTMYIECWAYSYHKRKVDASDKTNLCVDNRSFCRM